MATRSRKKSGIMTIVLAALGGFVGGVVLSDKVKPMLSKIPMLGKMFGSASENGNLK